MIFCRECKWVWYSGLERNPDYMCKHEKNITHKNDYFTEWIDYKSCKEANKHNHCHYFEEDKTIWKKLEDFVNVLFR